MMKGTRHILKTLILAWAMLLAGLCQNVGADTLYMTDGAYQVRYRSSNDAPPSILYTVDTETGKITPVGSVGYYVTDLAWDRTSGTLYGATSWRAPLHNGLIKIDTTTGAGTPIGTTGWGTGELAHIYSIDVDASGDMYGGGGL